VLTQKRLAASEFAREDWRTRDPSETRAAPEFCPISQPLVASQVSAEADTRLACIIPLQFITAELDGRPNTPRH